MLTLPTRNLPLRKEYIGVSLRLRCAFHSLVNPYARCLSSIPARVRAALPIWGIILIITFTPLFLVNISRTLWAQPPAKPLPAAFVIIVKAKSKKQAVKICNNATMQPSIQRCAVPLLQALIDHRIRGVRFYSLPTSLGN